MTFLESMPIESLRGKRSSRRKRPLLLIEVLIAISLLSILSTFLFFGFGYVSECHHMNEKVCQREKMISQSHQVLSRVFSQAVLLETPTTGKSKDKKPEEEKFFFFTSELALSKGVSQSLVFSFNNGVDRDPQFANEVLARIYVDEKHCLCLAIWPLTSLKQGLSPSIMRKEILVDNVLSLRFSFYQPPDEKKLTVQTSDIQTGDLQKKPSPGKHQEWLQDYQQLPRLINLLLTMKGDESNPVVFSYLLPTLDPVIKIRGA